MADGYLESHYAEYEKKKAEWLKKKAKWSNRKSSNRKSIHGKSNSKDAAR